MPRRPVRAVPIVLIPGWPAGGPGHWLPWLAEQLAADGRTVSWAGIPGDPAPDRVSALAGLHAALDRQANGYDVVAHSEGAVLWLHHTAEWSDWPRPARVALVAPPSPLTAAPEFPGLYPPPLDIDAVRQAADGTVLVGGAADPALPQGIAAEYGAPLKMATTTVPGAAHLDEPDGHGPWPAVLDWCRRDNLAFLA